MEIYGLITKQNPEIIFIGYDQEKVRNAKRDARKIAGREIILFRYNGISITFPDEPTFIYQKEHGIQISKFTKLMIQTGNPLPSCNQNIGRTTIV